MNLFIDYFERIFSEIKENKLFSGVLGILLCLTLTLFFHTMAISSSHFAFLDVNKIVIDFSNSLSKNKNLTDDQKKMMSREFSNFLPEYINIYSENHHEIILNKNAIISTTKKSNRYKKSFMHHQDITSVFETNITQYMINYFRSVSTKEVLDKNQ